MGDSGSNYSPNNRKTADPHSLHCPWSSLLCTIITSSKSGLDFWFRLLLVAAVLLLVVTPYSPSIFSRSGIQMLHVLISTAA